MKKDAVFMRKSNSRAQPVLSIRKLKHDNVFRYIWYKRYLYVLLIPAIVYYIIFHYLPMYGVTIAFKDFNFSKGILGSSWIGFEHFQYLFRLNKFWTVFWNTLIISFYRLIFGFPMPIIVAILLNEVRGKVFKRTIQTAIFLPHFLSWVIFGGILLNVLSIGDGFVNEIIRLLGGKPIGFLSDPSYFRGTLVGTMIWKELGWGTILYFAALSAIDVQLYEAAIVDGCKRWQRIWHITLPGIRSTIAILLILRLGHIMQAGFQQIFLMYNPAVYDVADIIDTYVYRIGLTEGRFSRASAVGLFKSVINFVLLLSANMVSKKLGEEGIF